METIHLRVMRAGTEWFLCGQVTRDEVGPARCVDSAGRAYVRSEFHPHAWTDEATESEQLIDTNWGVWHMNVTDVEYDEHTNKTWGTVQVPGNVYRMFVSGKLNADEFLAWAGPVIEMKERLEGIAKESRERGEE